MQYEKGHVLIYYYLPLTGLMSHYTTPFTKRVVNKYGSKCHCYWSFFNGTLHMWARIDEEYNYKEKMFTFQTWQKIIKHYPMTGRLIVTRGYIYIFVLLIPYNIAYLPVHWSYKKRLIGSYTSLYWRSGISSTSVRNSVFSRVERSGTSEKK